MSIAYLLYLLCAQASKGTLCVLEDIIRLAAEKVILLAKVNECCLEFTYPLWGELGTLFLQELIRGMYGIQDGRLVVVDVAVDMLRGK